MNLKTAYTLLTFYKFVDVQNPVDVVRKHKQFCQDIGMFGRIYIGEEWISATVSCNTGQLRAYKLFLQNSEYFRDIPDIDSKASRVDGHTFKKMIVKYRKEIVALGIQVHENQVQQSYKKIPIEKLKEIIESNDPNYEILDMRNTYEWKLGHFKGAIPAATNNFREVKEMINKYVENFADKKIIMYCTWWIRCEKLSVLLEQEWINNFYALDGGVVKYVNTFNDGNWLGNLYTFDDLVTTQIGDEHTHTKVGECIYSGKKSDFVENCRYSACNARIIATRREYKRHLGFCSQECFDEARQDLLIKTDTSIDPHNYKELRGDIKSWKKTFADVQQKVSSFLDEKLWTTPFNHATPQKEDIVDACVVDDFFGWK